MIKELTVQAYSRDGWGKGFARRLRTSGMVPVAVYGEGKNASAVAVKATDLAGILRSDTGHNTIFKLALPGDEPATVIIKDWQVDPVRGKLLHADLMRLSMTTATRVTVNLVTIGEPVGVKLDAGILEIEMREIPIECLPGDIPERIQVDVTNLRVGQHATVADLICDREKIKILVDPDQVVAGVMASRLVEEVAPAPPVGAEPAPAAEPEVIKKGKPEES